MVEGVVRLLLAGLVATILLTVVLRGGQLLGLTRMDLPLILGLWVTKDRERAKFLGVFVHILVGWPLAAVYAGVFWLLGGASWWLGGLAGFVHALFVLLVVLPGLPGVHPRMASERTRPDPTRHLQPPGLAGLNYGRRTAVATVIGHVVYGIVLGILLRT